MEKHCNLPSVIAPELILNCDIFFTSMAGSDNRNDVTCSIDSLIIVYCHVEYLLCSKNLIAFLSDAPFNKVTAKLAEAKTVIG